jgi:hypothetical protein
MHKQQEQNWQAGKGEVPREVVTYATAAKGRRTLILLRGL